jgi:hypothetical protein
MRPGAFRILSANLFARSGYADEPTPTRVCRRTHGLLPLRTPPAATTAESNMLAPARSVPYRQALATVAERIWEVKDKNGLNLVAQTLAGIHQIADAT